jgi:hypothetical protein
MAADFANLPNKIATITGKFEKVGKAKAEGSSAKISQYDQIWPLFEQLCSSHGSCLYSHINSTATFGPTD